MRADFGVEEFPLDFPDGPAAVKGDVYQMASEVAAAYQATEGKPLADRTAALNAVYHAHGLPDDKALGPVAADKLASLVTERGLELKNDVWATKSGSEGPASPATTPA